MWYLQKLETIEILGTESRNFLLFVLTGLWKDKSERKEKRKAFNLKLEIGFLYKILHKKLHLKWKMYLCSSCLEREWSIQQTNTSSMLFFFQMKSLLVCFGCGHGLKKEKRGWPFSNLQMQHADQREIKKSFHGSETGRGVNVKVIPTWKRRPLAQRKYYFTREKNWWGHNAQTLREDEEEKAESKQSAPVRSPNNQDVPWALLSPGVKKERKLELSTYTGDIRKYEGM